MISLLMLVGCTRDELPALPALPALPDELREIPDVLTGLELPELGDLEWPEIGTLPALEAPKGGILFAGPAWKSLRAGDPIAGADVIFEGVDDGAGVFTIQGMRSPRRLGDSVEYSGPWPHLPESQYDARLRILWIGDDEIRLGGVQRLLLPSIQPAPGPRPVGAPSLAFPFVDGATVEGNAVDGTTLHYLGRYDRGAQFTGLPQGEYPYRQVGDSLAWTGSLGEGVNADYDLRVLRFGRDGVRVGGIVGVFLPAP